MCVSRFEYIFRHKQGERDERERINIDMFVICFLFVLNVRAMASTFRLNSIYSHSMSICQRMNVCMQSFKICNNNKYISERSDFYHPENPKPSIFATAATATATATALAWMNMYISICVLGMCVRVCAILFWARRMRFKWGNSIDSFSYLWLVSFLLIGRLPRINDER